jgi:polar amino acid transport system permease protein
MCASPALFPLRMFGALYTDIFRGLPVILVIYLVGFGIPGLGLPRPWNSPYIWGSLALILVYAAYVAEVFRSGIESIHQSQRAPPPRWACPRPTSCASSSCRRRSATSRPPT